MQKISNLVLLAFGAVVSSGMAQAQETPKHDVDEVLRGCFDTIERLARLKCYDDYFGRPNLIGDLGTKEEVVPVERIATVPPAIAYANALLNAPDRIEETVAVTFKPVEGVEEPMPLDWSEEGLIAFLSAPRSEEEDKRLRLENDLFLAVESDASIGEPATLILSCENNISRLKVVFGEPFDGKFIDARFYASETLTEDKSLQRKLWIRGQGYLIENARGLDSIQLMARIVSGSRSQIAVGNGETIRSAFFETDALKKGLPLLARQCSWSSDVSN